MRRGIGHDVGLEQVLSLGVGKLTERQEVQFPVRNGHVGLDKVFDALPRCRQHRDSGAGMSDVEAVRPQLVEYVFKDHLVRP